MMRWLRATKPTTTKAQSDDAMASEAGLKQKSRVADENMDNGTNDDAESSNYGRKKRVFKKWTPGEVTMIYHRS